MNWIEIPGPISLEDQHIQKINIAGKSICIIVNEGKVTATSARCPHAGADLSSGWCEKGRLICPYHRHAFDLQTGRGDPGQGDYIRIYPLKFENNKWFVGMKKPWYRFFSS